MSANQNLTIEELKSQLKYDPITGEFFRIGRPKGSSTPMGLVTTAPTKLGYIRFRVLGRKYMAHQLAYLYMTGAWAEQVDHDNRVRSDNRWANLNKSCDADNRKNMSRRKSNGTGTSGVTWSDSLQRYIARITVDYKQIWLGQFRTLLAADYARHLANIKYGFHANHWSSTCNY